MSYTVLARKYRSRTLDELVGQDHVVTTLKNAIESGRVHHGYLFCGTRGVGKTSAARILAKSLNCLNCDGPTVHPCLECDSCLAIAEGEDIDVIEIDAASNTGVDNIRDLRSNASYRPARSRYKIYIVDEVHMLSTGAFNALLKTLEEPPEHVKFIFATTEQQKVPATIQSRVQRFEFQSLSVATIVQQLTWILKQEGVEADEDVLRRVAHFANGSMRDGLSLLDQLLSLGTDRLSGQAIDEMLPSTHDEQLAELIGSLAAGDAAKALVLTDQYLARGQTLPRFCENLIEHMRILMLLNVCGADTHLVDVPAGVKEQVVGLSKAFDAPALVYMISVLEELRRQIRASGAGRALTDAAIVRLALAEDFASIPALLEQMDGASAGDPKKKVSRPAAQAVRPGSSAGGKTPSGRPQAVSQPSALTPRPPRRATVSSGEVQAARSDPLVQQALRLFDGTLVNVEDTAHRRGEGDERSDPPVGDK